MGNIDERVLVHAPKGRDALVVSQVLASHGMRVDVCGSMAELAASLAEGAGSAFVTEEALSNASLGVLADGLEQQPPWSDFPFVVLATRRSGRRESEASDLLAQLGNVVILERPLHSETLVSAARAALRARTRQYAARRHLEEQDRARQAEHIANAEAVRANEALELALDAGELGTFHCPWPLDRIYWNATCKAHFWLPADAEIDFERFYSIIHEDDRERVREAIAAGFAGPRPYDVEYRTVSPAGAWRWLRAKGRVYRDATTGEPVRFDGITLDITHQKVLAAEREVLLAAERTARTQAEEASRMKDEFLATLSHELRTPLSAILGWTHLLARRQSAKVDVDKAVATIERNARAQARLIEELLDVSRITSGKLQLDIRRVSMVSIVDAVLSSLKPAADAKSISFETERSGTQTEITGDAHRLQQVVWNLVANAIKFTPRGGKVSVKLASEPGSLLVAVTDNGEGISPEFLPYVFERFRQADASTARKHGGLGLGLAIVRHLVELHGGTVHAESAGHGKGSVFALRLPQGEAAGAIGGTPSLLPVSRDEARPVLVGEADLNGRRILLVDDERDGRESVAQMLGSRGAAVTSAASAAEALAELKQSSYELLISDIGMPGVDGYELMRRVRALAHPAGAATPPAIALTAFARAEDEAQAHLAGFDAYLTKPVEPARLFNTAAALLASRASHDTGMIT